MSTIAKMTTNSAHAEIDPELSHSFFKHNVHGPIAQMRFRRAAFLRCLRHRPGTKYDRQAFSALLMTNFSQQWSPECLVCSFRATKNTPGHRTGGSAAME